MTHLVELARTAYIHLAAYTYNIKPDASAPGGHGIQKITNEAAFYALLAAGLGAVLAIIMIAIGKSLHLERIHTRGKEGVIIALGAAFFVAVVSQFLQAAYNA